MGGDYVRTALEQERRDGGDDTRAIGTADQQPGGIGRRVRYVLAIARGTLIAAPATADPAIWPCPTCRQRRWRRSYASERR